jgi:hypothetical protein
MAEFKNYYGILLEEVMKTTKNFGHNNIPRFRPKTWTQELLHEKQEN